MKKLLALVLACGMLLSLVACGTSSENEDTDKQTTTVNTTEKADEITGSTTTKNNENTNDTTDDSDTTKTTTTTTVAIPVDRGDLQAFYAKHFSGDVEFAGTSVSVDSEGVAMKFEMAADGSGAYEIGVGENVFKFYSLQDKGEYVYLKLSGEDESGEVRTEEGWFKYVPSEEATDTDMLESMTESVAIPSITKGLCENVVYKETKNNIDYVAVAFKEDALSEEMESMGGDWLIGVDAASGKIVSMSQEVDGVMGTMNFYSVDTVKADIPETAETMNEEDVAMAMMGIIFSAMGDSFGEAADSIS